MDKAHFDKGCLRELFFTAVHFTRATGSSFRTVGRITGNHLEQFLFKKLSNDYLIS